MLRKKTLSEEDLASLEPNEAAVLKLISAAPLKLDDIVEKIGLDFQAATEIITNLEISGYISRLQDGTYILS